MQARLGTFLKTIDVTAYGNPTGECRNVFIFGVDPELRAARIDKLSVKMHSFSTMFGYVSQATFLFQHSDNIDSLLWTTKIQNQIDFLDIVHPSSLISRLFSDHRSFQNLSYLIFDLCRSEKPHPQTGEVYVVQLVEMIKKPGQVGILPNFFNCQEMSVSIINCTTSL